MASRGRALYLLQVLLAARGFTTAMDFTHSAIALKIAPSPASVGAGVQVLRSLPTPELEAVGPFVFLDQFGPAAPPPGGVPAHPHAGIEVISYLLSGENDHRDSLGNQGTIAAGGAQWFSSGRGMLHAEMLRGGDDGLMNTVQLWTRQPAAFDDQPPRYGAFAADDVPQVDLPGAHIKLLSGELALYFAAPGPMRLQGPAQLIHITLAPGASATLPLKPSHEIAVYVLTGVAAIGGEQASRAELALLRPAPTVTLENPGSTPLDALLLGGERAPRPLVFRGPYVFNSSEAIEQAYSDYVEGRMGRLDGAPF
jgi:redox-sensitive bicupin YhaK (pirin superfamily)